MANINLYKKLWGSYSNFLQELEIENIYTKSLPRNFWDEPHDDMRGSSYLISSAAFPHVKEMWDYTPNYRGRRRYRGQIKNLTFSLREGVPDIWEFSFTLDVYKNESVFRRSSDAMIAANSEKQPEESN